MLRPRRSVGDGARRGRRRGKEGADLPVSRLDGRIDGDVAIHGPDHGAEGEPSLARGRGAGLDVDDVTSLPVGTEQPGPAHPVEASSPLVSVENQIHAGKGGEEATGRLGAAVGEENAHVAAFQFGADLGGEGKGIHESHARRGRVAGHGRIEEGEDADASATSFHHAASGEEGTPRFIHEIRQKERGAALVPHAEERLHAEAQIVVTHGDSFGARGDEGAEDLPGPGPHEGRMFGAPGGEVSAHEEVSSVEGEVGPSEGPLPRAAVRGEPGQTAEAFRVSAAGGHRAVEGHGEGELEGGGGQGRAPAVNRRRPEGGEGQKAQQEGPCPDSSYGNHVGIPSFVRMHRLPSHRQPKGSS